MSVSRETIVESVSVSRETTERLDRLAHLVLAWNRKINLVSRADERFLWERHISDSLQLAPLVPTQAASAIDIGSGAGFPGLVLAIATNIPFVLVESDSRKAAFLLEAARLTCAPARVLNARVENASLQVTPLITARAVAPLSQLLAWAAPRLASEGTLLLLKGKAADQEIEDASAAWTMQIDHRISRTGDGVILRITGIARA